MMHTVLYYTVSHTLRLAELQKGTCGLNCASQILVTPKDMSQAREQWKTDLYAARDAAELKSEQGRSQAFGCVPQRERDIGREGGNTRPSERPRFVSQRPNRPPHEEKTSRLPSLPTREATLRVQGSRPMCAHFFGILFDALYLSFQILRQQPIVVSETLAMMGRRDARQPIGLESQESSGTNCTGWPPGRGAHACTRVTRVILGATAIDANKT
jgi:hypothetical protein